MPPPAPGAPALGRHSLVYNRDGVVVSPLSIGPIATRDSGSTLLVCVGRGVVSAHAAPIDNKGNVYTQLGATHNYRLWQNSGTALYGCEASVGGSGHVVTAPKAVPADETTLSVVEVANGGVIGQFKWNEVLAGNPLSSQSISTTGPALLVAWWWGDANVVSNKTAVPDNGFSVIHSILLEGALVQCAVAVRQVAAAGTYHVTWAATPLQGAQLWIAAVQYSA